MKKNLIKNMTAAIAALFIALLALPQTALAQSNEAYVVENGSTLTFYYDAKKATHTTGTVYGINDKRKDDTTSPAWVGASDDPNERITKVVFDSSFKDYRPATTNSWFFFCSKLTEFEGMSNLITDQVTDMSHMFFWCSSLTSLDVSNFNTGNVTNMYGMFYECEKLTSLNVSNFNTANVTDMESMFFCCSALTSLDVSKFNTANVTTMRCMFSDCSALTSLDVSNFNTANVTDMHYMFYNCSALTSLDVSNFNTANVTYIGYMFSGCSTLTTIYCDDDWTKGVVTESENMFADCTNLKGAVAYDANKTNVTMANPTTGYFTKKDPSGIDAATVDTPAARRGIYTLNGVRLNTSPDNLPAGIYVIDGRKVVKR